MGRTLSEDNGLKLLMALCVPGFILSGYLSYGHYRVREITGGGTVCPTNTEGWACNDVLLSEYSEIMGIPVAVIGLLGIIMILVVALFRFLAMDLRSARWLPFMLGFLCTGGLAVTGWLTYVEVFLLEEICPYCFSVFIITILLETVTLLMYAPVMGKVVRGDMVVHPSDRDDDKPEKKKRRKGAIKKENRARVGRRDVR